MTPHTRPETTPAPCTSASLSTRTGMSSTAVSAASMSRPAHAATSSGSTRVRGPARVT